MTRPLRMTIGDGILMAALTLIALSLLVWPLLSQPAAEAEILDARTGESTRLSLRGSYTQTITAQGMTLTISVADGALSILQSDCRDGICTQTPPISRAGQSIVCAPAGIIVRILGEEAMVDGVSG